MIGDDIAAALPEMRAHAESLMVDTCTIERATGFVMDPATREEHASWEGLYAGPCRVKINGTSATSVGGREYVIVDALLQLPVGSARFGKGDRVTVTACTFDPDLVGVELWVTAREVKSHATMRRVHVSEVQPA